ncbi:DMT family transporter [Oceaniglobus indicus]|uniref:DMT family transporter n=1 Tax=Oceaniglobus indicus TaxID=2047749 RepID=UPI000C1962CD|nr:DMT family transporter [Oceaniglobus indicus]
MSDNLRGALLMMTCMVAFTCNDALLKMVLDDLPLFQTLFLRGLLTALALFAIGSVVGGLWLPLLPRDRWLIGLRTIAEIIAAWLFLSALSNMPLANVSAILQVLPLVVTLASALFFRDPLGWRRLVAILIGFCGVLLIVRPGTDGFNTYSLYALASVVAVTVRDLSARRLSRGVPSLVVAFMTALGITAASGLAALFEPWAPIDAEAAGFILAATVFVIVGYLSSIAAMRVGDVAVVAPFRYVGLIAALILGFVVFGDWPAVPTLIGAAIVVGTGLFTLYRELRLARRVRQVAVLPPSRPT